MTSSQVVRPSLGERVLDRLYSGFSPGKYAVSPRKEMAANLRRVRGTAQGKEAQE